MTPRKHDDGFTLAETLIALWVVSIAMGCVLAGFVLLSRFEHATQKQVQTRREADAAIAALRHAVASGEALSVNAFSGDAHYLDYACAKGTVADNPRLCRLKWPEAWTLNYVSEARVYKTWPKLSQPHATQPPEAFILQDGAGATLGVVRIQAEEVRDCQFDTISRTCREEPK